MSVDFYSCECCGDARYEDCVSECPKCGRNICDECEVENVSTPRNIDDVEDLEEGQYQYLCDKYGKEFIDEIIENGEMNPEYCPFCNGDKVHTDDLLEFVLSKYLKMTEEELKAEYKKFKEGK